MDSGNDAMQAIGFDYVLKYLKIRHENAQFRIQRRGWNGKGLWVYAQWPDEKSKMTLPYLYIEYPDGQRCPWLASQTDIMADDWILGYTKE